MAQPQKTYGMTSKEIEALLEKARQRRVIGIGWHKIAAEFGVGENWLKRRLKPGYREHDNEKTRQRLYGPRIYY